MKHVDLRLMSAGFLLVLMALPMSCGLVAQGPTITVPWIYGGGPSSVSKMPSCSWLGSEGLLVDSGRGRISLLDPATGKQSAWLSADGRQAAQRAAQSPRPLGSPDGFAESMPRVYWHRGEVLVVLDVDANEAMSFPAESTDSLHRLAPNGQRMAFVRGNDLYVTDLETGRNYRLTHDGSETIQNGTLPWVYWEELFGRQDIGYWWSPDSMSIAFLRSDQSLVTEVTYVDMSPAVPNVRRQRYPKAGTANPVVRVGLLDVTDLPRDGRPADFPPPVWVHWKGAQPEYIARVQWLPSSDRIAVQTLDRKHQQLDLWFCDYSTGEPTHVLKETDPGWVNVHDDLRFIKQGEEFLWVSERTGFGHIYRYSIDGKLLNPVTTGEWSVKGSTPIFWLRQAIAGFDEEQSIVYFGALKEDRLETHFYRVGLDGKGMERITQRPGTHTISLSPDCAFFTDEHSSIDTPPSLRVAEASGKTTKMLQSPRSEAVTKLEMVMPELTTVPARDGYKMPAYIYRPKDLDPKVRYPVIMYTYGGPSSRSVTNSWDFGRYFNQVLLREGFVVICVDNRSATGESKALENVITGQMTGDLELADVEDAVGWVKSQPFCDPARVGIWGWSNGGMMTLMCMTRTQHFKAGIAVAPVTDWRLYDTIWTETVNKTPQENPKGYASCNLLNRASDLHGRLLLVHGTHDDNVHIQNSYLFMNQLLKAGKMFDFMVYPMRKHGIADGPARIHLFRRMVEFWNQNLK